MFCVLFVCKYVLYYCHQVSTQLLLTNISYHIISYIIAYIISYHIINAINCNGQQTTTHNDIKREIKSKIMIKTQIRTANSEVILTLWNWPQGFSCVTLPASHCYSVPMLASLFHKLASYLLTHWFAVQDLFSSVHAGAAAVWERGNIQFYGTIAILKNHLMNVLQIFPLQGKRKM